MIGSADLPVARLCHAVIDLIAAVAYGDDPLVRVAGAVAHLQPEPELPIDVE